MIPDNVIITNRLEDTLKEFFQSVSYSNVIVLVDENTENFCYPIVKASLPQHLVCQIKSGEVFKILETCSKVWQFLTDNKIDRNALFINLGGGVIGDMGGFCASTYKRGIDFINIPTTLLAQVDAAVGGKLGIDFHGFKNHIGLFRDPLKVIINAGFLSTLSQRELRSGFAEVIKHSLIADKNYWPNIVENNFEQQNWAAHITHSVEVKAGVVGEDFKEKGLRKILNFGHTIGHAIETYYLETTSALLHGEAIAIGMICEGYLSTKKSGLTNNQFQEITTFISKIYDYVEISDADVKKIAALANQDKKNEGARILCTLLSEIGSAKFDVQITESEIMEALNYYKNLKVEN